MSRRDRSNVFAVLVLLAVVYLAIAGTVFSFRHPWATRTESFIYTWEALNFQKVPYEAMRPREGR